MRRIHSEMLVSEILYQFPEVVEVFLMNGFEDFGHSDLVMQIGPFLRLKTALRARQINEVVFVNLLNDRIDSVQSYNNLKDCTSVNEMNKNNLLALLPCPLKVPLQIAFKRHLDMKLENVQSGLDYLIEGNANNQLSYYQYVDQFNEIEDVPDIVISPGLNSFYHQRFINQFIDKGHFVDLVDYDINDRFKKIGLKDPENNYTLFTMNLLVMVVDHTRLGNLDMPKRWEDLMQPEFKKSVAIRGNIHGQKDYFCETTLLTFYKEYGIEGVRKFGESVKYGWHPSQMVKNAGTGNSDAPIVSVMPYFFSKTIKNKENVTVVWPEEGAIVSPVTMLVKASKADKVKEFAKFFTSQEVGEICERAYFPSIHPKVESRIPEDAALNWIGWDFIKSQDVGQIVDYLTEEFVKEFNKI